MGYNYISDLKEFINSSVVNFLAVDTARNRLEAAGFVRLREEDSWAEIEPGGRYFVIKNDSAIFAFVVGDNAPEAGFRIITAHSDSPGFRIKPNAEIYCSDGTVKLNTEVYGGPILYTWFDRPLSIAGRVILSGPDPMRPITRLVKFERPLLTIPHLAIHFNRTVNDGIKLSKQKDMLPVIGRVEYKGDEKGLLTRLVAEELGVEESRILDFDLSLYDTSKATIEGLNGEYISSGRLDDLSMMHAALTALLESDNMNMTRVIAIFDNEETGSGTKQGAASPILHNILRRINNSIGGTEEDYFRAIANSFMVSADNAHGIHPNYPEKQDPTNHPFLGGGPVIKINANCKYMTDADSAAVFRTICQNAGVPFQYFVNHSDVAGGSTLGNILTSQIDLRGVDMGAALWAMHSVRETASVADHEYIIRAFIEFFNC
ncbi:MAG: M18 family aminopeptidase [Paramuribaculum sp.]|nr:M18 family aminopeptidase [Paramuribaculum sp.]